LQRKNKLEREKQKEKKVRTVEMKIVIINGNKRVLWNGEENWQEAMRKQFGTQGQLYSEVFGVSAEDAREAGWYPAGKSFTGFGCAGWRKFFADRGKIHKVETTRSISVEEAIFEVEE